MGLFIMVGLHLEPRSRVGALVPAFPPQAEAPVDTDQLQAGALPSFHHGFLVSTCTPYALEHIHAH